MARMNANALARRDRDRRAMRLRAQGMPWPEIARECEYPTAHSALLAVERLDKKDAHEHIELSRAIQRERLEALLRSLWLGAINPGMALKAARENGQPDPPSQEKAIDLLLHLLDRMAKVEGTDAPVKAEITGPNGGPIEGRIDVMHWTPDDAFMARYAVVLREAGLMDEPIEGEVRQLGPGDDPELASE